MSDPLPIKRFSHLCVGVSDMDASLAFYTGLLGMDVVFDVQLDGAALESVTGVAGAAGRMVGGLIGGAMVELLDLGEVPAVPSGPHRGYTNMSFVVADLDAVYQQVTSRGDVTSAPPVDIGGVRMFFVYDPDGTPIEFIELPGGAESTEQLWRPVG
jgi:catechol 2,3-dioxygenase-like lactoylglutathione lyase family enzyme